MRGIMMGATVVSASAGTICALLWKEAMCARRKTPAAAASLSPSNTVSGTLPIMAKQLNRLDSSAILPGPNAEGAAAKRAAGGDAALAKPAAAPIGGSAAGAAQHGRPGQPACRARGADGDARCRQQKGNGGAPGTRLAARRRGAGCADAVLDDAAAPPGRARARERHARRSGGRGCVTLAEHRPRGLPCPAPRAFKLRSSSRSSSGVAQRTGGGVVASMRQ